MGRIGFPNFGWGEPVFFDSGQPAGNSMGELPAALVLGQFNVTMSHRLRSEPSSLTKCHRFGGLSRSIAR